MAEDVDGAHLTVVDADGATRRQSVPSTELPARVRELEREGRPRWVWADTATTYGRLLRSGVRVERCYDLRLCRKILRRAVDAPPPSDVWDGADESEDALDAPPTLFESAPLPREEVAAERGRQREAVAASRDPGRLATLLAAELAGALVAAEMRQDDRQRLISLTFKLIPARHRLGLMTDEIKEKVLKARALFREQLPPGLSDAVEFFDIVLQLHLSRNEKDDLVAFLLCL